MDIVSILIGLIAGGGGGFLAAKQLQKKKDSDQISNARKEAAAILKDANIEAENIKKDKILQAKEKFIELKAEHEQVILQRDKKVAEVEKPTPYDGHNARAEGLAKKDLAGVGVSVRTSGLGRSDFAINKNSLGVPLDRTLPVYVLVARGDEPYCRELVYQYTETYAGGGYAIPTVNLIQTRFVSCR